ncbi:MAG TPA: S1C family serine protease [Candidatus Dormibacteraeota bacterium]|nr:S1C family serine protease [Candidatus Dormibacteraeota bacterium]
MSDGVCPLHGAPAVGQPEPVAVPGWLGVLGDPAAEEASVATLAPPQAPAPVAVAPAAPRRRRRLLWAGVALIVLALIATPATFAVVLSRQVSDLRAQLGSASAQQSRTVDALQKDLAGDSAALRGLNDRLSQIESKVNQQPDTAAIAKQVGPSVFEVHTDSGLGTGWVFAASGGSSQLLTNYHVISDVWESGGRSVRLLQGDATYQATITKVDSDADLAVLSTPNTFPVLQRETAAVAVGDPVLVVGSSLGFEGTVSSGLVSGFRTEDGHDLVQFSAPVSPGNSGGPVVDRAGRVIGITELKIVTSGAEGLSFAIPVATACKTVLTC